MTQSGVARWSSGGATAPTGQCDNGLKDPAVDANPSPHGANGASGVGTNKLPIPHYSVVPGASPLSLHAVSASSSISGVMGAGVSASVAYTAAVSPVTIIPGGATSDGSGGYDILIGQHCAPVLKGFPTQDGSPDSDGWSATYQWTVTGTTFQTWQPTTLANPPAVANPDASYYVSGPGPLNGPGSNGYPFPPGWYWNDLSQTPETITCTATVQPPAGEGSSFSVTATQTVMVMVPIWTASGTGGYMQIATLSQYTYELGAGPTVTEYANSQIGGMNWIAAVQTPPQPAFGYGQLEIVQIITPNDSYTTGPLDPQQHDDPLNQITGLDTGYP